MGQSTQLFKRTISGSIGSGMKSIMGNNGRRYYILEHKITSKYHKAGEEQKLIVDQIELGRDPKCAVCIDGDEPIFRTVSRRHAAIVRDGDNWKLIHLSQTNSTILNGQKMQTREWYLQNGDEIQLSENGPKLGFKIPQGDKSLVKTINLTSRLNLFRQQALRPYKQGIIALSCLLVLCIVFGCFWGYRQHGINELNQQVIKAQTEQMNLQNAAYQNSLDSIKRQNGVLTKKLSNISTAYKKMQEQVQDLTVANAVTSDGNNVAGSAIIRDCQDYVYFIQTTQFDITTPEGEKSSITYTNGQNLQEDTIFMCLGYTGTGFKTSDGKFITARHVAEGWYYWQDASGINPFRQYLNYIVNNGGKVVTHFVAVSPTGEKIRFKSSDFRVNRTTDHSIVDESGNRLSHASLDYTDWAYISIGGGSGLNANIAKSSNMEVNRNLVILGFPMGLGASTRGIVPMYSEAKTAHDGLQEGVIITTATTYETGNSGGPVLYENRHGELEVIGIVSAGSGRSTGFVVPLSAMQ